MSEILERGVFLNCLLDQTEAPWQVEVEMVLRHDAALRAEVESLRERLDKEEEERGRQYGLRLQIADEFAFLRELLVAVVKTGTKDPLLDARLAEELRSHE